MTRPPTRPRLPTWAWALARWSAGIAIVAFLLVRFDAGQVAIELGGANLWLAAIGIAGLVAMHLVGAVTWLWLRTRVGLEPMPLPTGVRTYYVAQGLGVLTPANLGADAYRIYAAREASGWRGALLPIAVQRVTSSAALAGLAALALLGLPDPRALALPVVAAAIALAVGSAVLLLVFRSGRGDGRWRWLPTGVGWRELRSGGAIGLGLGAIFHAGSIGLSTLLVASVTPIHAPLAVLACVAIARLSILIPISPSGLGFQEGALSLLFLQIGMPAQAALAAALLNRGSLLVLAGVGAVALGLGRSMARTRAPAESLSFRFE